MEFGPVWTQILGGRGRRPPTSVAVRKLEWLLFHMVSKYSHCVFFGFITKHRRDGRTNVTSLPEWMPNVRINKQHYWLRAFRVKLGPIQFSLYRKKVKLANTHFGRTYSIAIALVLRHSLAELGINSIPGWDVFAYSNAWDNSDQCLGNSRHSRR